MVCLLRASFGPAGPTVGHGSVGVSARQAAAAACAAVPVAAPLYLCATHPATALVASDQERLCGGRLDCCGRALQVHPSRRRKDGGPLLRMEGSNEKGLPEELIVACGRCAGPAFTAESLPFCAVLRGWRP